MHGGFDIPADSESVYFIDYGSAQILPAGPGSGIKVRDWKERRGKVDPRDGTDNVDPYAYDVFMVVYTICFLASVSDYPPTRTLCAN